jgi:anti-sigma-K factor RskA
MNERNLSQLSHEEIVEMLPAFVVGTLDPDEMLVVDAYLLAHPELTERVRELEVTFANLSYAAPSRPLPKALHAKVMNRAHASLPARSQPLMSKTQPVRTAPSGRVALPLSPARPAPRQGWLAGIGEWWRTRGLFTLALAGTAVAALVLSIALGRALYQVDGLRQQVEELDQQVALIRSEKEQLEEQNVRLQSELDLQLNQMASLAGATQMVALGGTEAAPDASGRLYLSGHQATLVLSNLGSLDSNQIYQLWLIPHDGAPLPAGLLGHGGSGVETISLGLPTTLEDIGAVGISVEPPSGSTAPTGPIVLLGKTV